MTRSTTRRTQLTIVSVLLVLTLWFIFSNSLQTREDSSALSQKVLAWIKPFLSFFLGEEHVTEHLIRKLAHFAEFFVLGVEYAIFARLNGTGSLLPLFLGLLTALTDETLQLISRRGSQVQDVWLDFSGICAAVLVYSQIHRRKGHHYASKRSHYSH